MVKILFLKVSVSGWFFFLIIFLYEQIQTVDFKINILAFN